MSILRRRYKKIGSCIGGRLLSFTQKLVYAGLEFEAGHLGDFIIWKKRRYSVDLIKIKLTDKGYNVLLLS